MKLLVTGGTGFIGRPLCRSLAKRGHQLTVLTRHPDAQPRQSDVTFLPWALEEWGRSLGDVDGVINLAGESIVAKRWTARRKQELTESRVGTTRHLVRAIAESPRKPSVFIQASAIGYYGPRSDEELTEADSAGGGFLAELCQAWEAEAQRAEPFGVRVVRLRIGIVLARDGGALAKMAPPFRAWVGGPLGHGRQWMSWIHRDDLIGIVHWALGASQVSGAVNATAPGPVRMREFAATLGRILRRPSWAPVPAVILRLMLGEMAEILLTGQRVIPQAALAGGYRFLYPELPPALAAIFSFAKMW